MRSKLFLILLIFPILFGCSTIQGWIGQGSDIDLQNAEASRKLADAQLKTWSLNSGFIEGLGLTDKLKFPITLKSEKEAQAILTSSSVLLGLSDLDQICKDLGYWNEKDYLMGKFLGTKARAGGQSILSFIKDFFPQLMKFAPQLFGI